MLESITMVIYHGIFNLRKSRYYSKLPWYFYNTGQKYHSILTPEKGGTTVNYHGIFITLAPGANDIKLFLHCLKPFQGKTSILCYKAILPQYLQWKDSKSPWYLCKTILYNKMTVQYCGMGVNYHSILNLEK